MRSLISYCSCTFVEWMKFMRNRHLLSYFQFAWDVRVKRSLFTRGASQSSRPYSIYVFPNVLMVIDIVHSYSRIDIHSYLLWSCRQIFEISILSAACFHCFRCGVSGKYSFWDFAIYCIYWQPTNLFLKSGDYKVILIIM